LAYLVVEASCLILGMVYGRRFDRRMSISSLVFALVTTTLSVAFIGLDHEIWALLLAPAAAWFAFLTFAPGRGPKVRPDLGRRPLERSRLCRGWEIDGRTGSGKTASGVVPIIHALKLNRPEVGILALDTKGDLSEPLNAIAGELGREPDIRQLEVRPDGPPSGWEPRYTMNILGDRSIPFSIKDTTSTLGGMFAVS
jgi:hypothetical protein